MLYNLVHTTRGPVPVAAQGQAGSQARLRLDAAAKAWKAHAETSRHDSPEFLVIPLEHEYTHKSMLFAGLKGRDRVMAGVLRSCPGFEIHLAARTKHEFGAPEDDHWGDYEEWGCDREVATVTRESREIIVAKCGGSIRFLIR